MDREDLRSLGGGREIDEEDFVEAAAACELRRQVFHFVGGGGHEDGCPPFLQPCQEGAEDPSVSRIGAAATQPFLDLVDPEDHRGDRFHRADGFVDRMFGGRRGEDFGEIEANEREREDVSGGFADERFAAALHPAHEHSAWLGEAERTRACIECGDARSQPALEHVETADFFELDGRGGEVQARAPAEGTALLRDDPGEGAGFVLGKSGQAKCAPRFVEGEAHRRADERVVGSMHGPQLRVKLGDERRRIG